MQAQHSAHSRALDREASDFVGFPAPCEFPARDSFCGKTLSWCSTGQRTHEPTNDLAMWQQFLKHPPPQLRSKLLQDAKLCAFANNDAIIFNPKSLAFSLTERQEPKLNAWFPERGVFWREEGKQIAWRNLWVSMFNLMVAFGVWLMWSALAVQIQIIHDSSPDKFNFGFDRLDFANSTRLTGTSDVDADGSISAGRKYHAML